MQSLNKTPPPIGRISLDLLPNIMGYLSKRDLVNLFAATVDTPYSPVSVACEEELDVSKYLEKEFGEGRRLLRCMSRGGVVLSGEMCSKYFVDHYIMENPQWRFSMTFDKNICSRFMYDLELLGVEWFTPAKTLDLLCSGELRDSFYSVMIPLGSCDNMVGRCSLQSIAERHLVDYRPSNVARSEEDDCIVFSTGTGDLSCFTCRFWGNNSTKPYFIVYGRKDNKFITLTVMENTPPLDLTFPLMYGSRFMRCYISAHIACHMYGAVCQNSPSRASHIEDAGNSPDDRTFGRDYVDRDLDCANAHRSAGDRFSTTVPVYNHIGEGKEILREYELAHGSVKWIDDYPTAWVTGGGRDVPNEPPHEVREFYRYGWDAKSPLLHRILLQWIPGSEECVERVEQTL